MVERSHAIAAWTGVSNRLHKYEQLRLYCVNAMCTAWRRHSAARCIVKKVCTSKPSIEACITGTGKQIGVSFDVPG